MSGLSDRPIIIWMPSTSRPQQRDDHRLRDLVRGTGDLTIATDLGVPRSTARGWPRAAPRVVVTLDLAHLTEPELRQEILAPGQIPIDVTFYLLPASFCLKANTNEEPMRSINLAEKLSDFSELWQPRTIAEFNGHDLMLVKVKGAFVWHKHDDTDDFFLVLRGRITIQMRAGNVTLGPGELFVVPKGVEHCPVAEEKLTFC